MFSPYKIYEESTKLMEVFEKECNIINKTMCKNVIVNLIYYASIIPNFKYSTCDILLRILKFLNN